MHLRKFLFWLLFVLNFSRTFQQSNVYRYFRTINDNCIDLNDPEGVSFDIVGNNILFRLFRATATNNEHFWKPNALCDLETEIPNIVLYQHIKVNGSVKTVKVSVQLTDPKENLVALFAACDSPRRPIMSSLSLNTPWDLPRCNNGTVEKLSVHVTRSNTKKFNCPMFFVIISDSTVSPSGTCMTKFNDTVEHVVTYDNDNYLLATNTTLEGLKKQGPKMVSIQPVLEKNSVFHVQNLQSDCPLLYRIRFNQQCNIWNLKFQFFNNENCTLMIDMDSENLAFTVGNNVEKYNIGKKTQYEIFFIIENDRLVGFTGNMYHTVYMDFCSSLVTDPFVPFPVEIVQFESNTWHCNTNLWFEIADNAVVRISNDSSNSQLPSKSSKRSKGSKKDSDTDDADYETSDTETSKSLPAYAYVIIAICCILFLGFLGFAVFKIVQIYRKKQLNKPKQDSPIAEVKTIEKSAPIKEQEASSILSQHLTTEASSVCNVTKQGTAEKASPTLQNAAKMKLQRKLTKTAPRSRRVISAEDIRDVVDSPMAILPPTSTAKRLKHVHFRMNYTYPTTMVNYNTVKQPLIRVNDLFQLLPFTGSSELPIESHVFFRYRDLTTENNSAFRHFRTRLLEPSFDDEAPTFTGTTLVPITVRVYVLDHEPPAFEIHFPHTAPPEFIHKLTGCRPCQNYASLEKIPPYYSLSKQTDAVEHLKHLVPGTHTYVNVDTLPEDSKEEEIMTVYAFRSIAPNDLPPTPRRSPLQLTEHRHTVKLRSLDDTELTAHGILLTKFIVTPIRVSASNTSHLSTTGMSSTAPASSFNPSSTTQLDSTNASDFSTKSNLSNVSKKSGKSTKGTKQLS